MRYSVSGEYIAFSVEFDEDILPGDREKLLDEFEKYIPCKTIKVAVCRDYYDVLGRIGYDIVGTYEAATIYPDESLTEDDLIPSLREAYEGLLEDYFRLLEYAKGWITGKEGISIRCIATPIDGFIYNKDEYKL